MNKLLEEIEKFRKEKKELDDKVKRNNDEISVLRRKLDIFIKEKELLLNEIKDMLSDFDLDTSICFNVVSSNRFYVASDYWDYYFYNYSKGVVVVKRVYERNYLKYDVCVNLNYSLMRFSQLSYEELNNIEYMESLFKKVIENLIEIYNPSSWEELKEIVDKSIQDGTFFEELYKNKDKVRSLSKNI